jgi:hypothetical protein
MSLFGTALADHLAEVLDASVKDVTDALNSFNPSEENTKNGKTSSTKAEVKSKSKEPEKKVPTKTTANNTNEKKSTKPAEKHTCERVKRGSTDPCGKNASRSIGTGKNQKWFCGGEKSGCYQAELNAAAKKDTENKAIAKNTKEVTTKETVKSKAQTAKTNDERKKASDDKSKSLVHEVLKNMVVVKKTINGQQIYYEKTRRLAFDNDKQEFYGKLGSDGKIEQMTDDDVKWVESRGYTIRQESNKSQAKHKSREKEDTKKEIKKPVPEATVESADSSEDEVHHKDVESDEDNSSLTLSSDSELSDDELTSDVSDDA